MNDLIDAQPTIEPEPHWIPCSERLPEEDNCTGSGVQYSDDVLITVINTMDEETVIDYGHTTDGEWYEDGRTRCPIEEHYALPKDGYCHLWEKRKDWEDDYVKRPEEGEK